MGGPGNVLFSPVGVQNMCSTNNSVSVLPIFKDTIYTISQTGQFYPKYFLNFGKQSMPESMRYGDFSSETSSLSAILDSDFVHSKIYLLETGNSICFAGIVKEKYFFVLFNQQTKKVLVFDRIFDDVGGIFIPYPIASSGDYLVGFLNPSDIEAYIKELDIMKNRLHIVTTNNQENLRNLLNNINANPIIVKYQVKQLN
jgi:hypothetical protein